MNKEYKGFCPVFNKKHTIEINYTKCFSVDLQKDIWVKTNYKCINEFCSISECPLYRLANKYLDSI